MITIPTPDLSTPEGARKALHDVTEAARSMQAENADIKGKMDVLKADLVAATQALAEQGRRQSVVTDGSDAELRAFVRDDGKLRATGEQTDDAGWMPGLLDSAPVCKWQAELQEAVEVRNIVRAVKSARRPDLRSTVTPKCDARVRAIVNRAPDSVKRAFGDISTAGAEWYPDVMLPVLERDFVLTRRVASLFGVMPMSAKNLLLPFLTTGLRPYLKNAVAADDPSQYTSSSLVTAQRTIDAVGFAVRSQLDEESTEDSLIDSSGLIRQELITALVDGEEDAIINGDTAGTHQDTALSSWNIRSRWGATGLGTAADHRKAWIGLRARATDVSCTTDGGSAETTAGFITAKGQLDSPHGVAGDLVCIVSPEYYLLKMTGFSEVLTVDKFGPSATIFSGQLAALLGVPIVISEFVDAKYNASGIYDAVTETKTGFILCNRQRFKLGMRRGAAVEIDKDITRGIFNLVGTVREVMFTVDSSTKKNVHWNYNHTAS